MFAKNSPMDLIEIRRITKDRGLNNSSRKETVNISDIKRHRVWHKGINDSGISGEITVLYVKKNKQSSTRDEKINDKDDELVTTILIEESYQSFCSRLANNEFFVKD